VNHTRNTTATARTRLCPWLAGGLLLCGLAAHAAAPQPPPFERVRKDDRDPGRMRHTGAYPRFHVAWSRATRLAGVTGVFPHPVLPECIAVAERRGLALSADAGRTWRVVPAAAPEKLGAVAHVAFDPRTAETFYLATRERGVWATTDGGKTLRRIGSKAAGMAADATCAVYLFPADRRHRTLLAVHGDAAPGISVSDDAGKSWRVLSADYLVYKLACSPPASLRLYAAAAKTDKPDVRGVYSCASPGQPWFVVLRDVVPVDLAFPRLRGGVYCATADAGLYLITHEGADFQKIGPEEPPRLASLGVAWGHHADAQIVYAYEPTRRGMLVSADGLKTLSAHSRGLYTSPFVREGAHLRANANGTAFFAVANGILSRGFRIDGRLVVSQVAVSPPAVSYASRTREESNGWLRHLLPQIERARYAAPLARHLVGLARDVESALSSGQITITARVFSRGAAKTPPTVTADLTRLGGSHHTPMLDDGQHGDGKPGDGVYGATLPLDPSGLARDGRDWRRPWPSTTPLTVSATADGTTTGTVGLFYLYNRPESLIFWRDGYSVSCRDPEGTLKIDIVEAPFHPCYSERAWRLSVGPGPWMAPIGDDYTQRDITGLHALSFWVKTDGPPDGHLSVQIRDLPTYAFRTATPPLDIVAEKLIDGGSLTSEYRRVVVPLSRMLGLTPGFHTRLFCHVIFSGKAPTARHYWIDDVKFFYTPDDLQTDIRRTQP